ncbi:hypothetical protein [Priestia flexa]|uniref:hypothetical protein n=1 Tax=Priestia flexa TaxID=86664 RepID=UPI0004736817|nr:hypothetical protein [Priestia flexa]
MPTGYTNDIHAGKEVSAKDYIMKCARAFGATVTMRDEPLSKEIPEFQPSTYHFEQIEKAKKRLSEAKRMTLEEAEKMAEESYQSRLEERAKIIADKTEMKNRYVKVLSEVNEWMPPTQEHVKLKEFAVKQLEDSIEFDCDLSFYECIPVKKNNPVDYLNAMIERAEENAKYHETAWNKEVEGVKQRNKWVKELRESLK